MRGGIPPLRYESARRGAELKAGTTYLLSKQIASYYIRAIQLIRFHCHLEGLTELWFASRERNYRATIFKECDNLYSTIL
jgi:hypothetical protein